VRGQTTGPGNLTPSTSNRFASTKMREQRGLALNSRQEVFEKTIQGNRSTPFFAGPPRWQAKYLERLGASDVEPGEENPKKPNAQKGPSSAKTSLTISGGGETASPLGERNLTPSHVRKNTGCLLTVDQGLARRKRHGNGTSTLPAGTRDGTERWKDLRGPLHKTPRFDHSRDRIR